MPIATGGWRATLLLTPEQTEALASVAAEKERSKSQLIDQIIRAYLWKQFHWRYPLFDRGTSSSLGRGAGNHSGVHTVLFSIEQAAMIDRAREELDHASFAHLFNTAATAMFSTLFKKHRWPARPEPRGAGGRPRRKSA